jgi:hypothetical protein
MYEISLRLCLCFAYVLILNKVLRYVYEHQRV